MRAWHSPRLSAGGKPDVYARRGHQTVLLELPAVDFALPKREEFERDASVYDLMEPVLEITADGNTNRL